MNVLWLCLLLIDMTASLKTLDIISVIISTKNYDTDTFLFFISYMQAFNTATGFVNLITK